MKGISPLACQSVGHVLEAHFAAGLGVVQVIVYMLDHRVVIAVEEMVGAIDDAVVDPDAFLLVQATHEIRDGGFLHHVVFCTLNDEAVGRTGGEEAEILSVRWRSDGDEALNFRAAHQELHPDPCAEGKAADPDIGGIGVDFLHPVERGSCIGKLAFAAIEDALRTANAAEVESQAGKAAGGESLKQIIGDFVIHGPAVFRTGMEDEGQRRVSDFGVRVTPFKTARRTIENYLRHEIPFKIRRSASRIFRNKQTSVYLTKTVMSIKLL